MAGSSTAALEVIEDGAGGTERSLRIRGTIAVSDGGPNAPGAWYLPGGTQVGRPSRPVDLTAKSQVVFWAKGDGVSYRLGLTFGPAGDLVAGVEFQSFRASNEWAEISLPLSGFVGADRGMVSGILFSGPEGTGSFKLQIDELRLR
jgi:hypothetical protein